MLCNRRDLPMIMAMADRSEDAAFEWREVQCADEAAARAEAERQQAGDSDDAEWIYLRHDGRWVARRTPRDWNQPTEKWSLGRTAREMVGEVFNPLNWF